MKETVAKLWKQSKFLTLSYIILWVIVLLLPFHAFLSTWLGTAIGPLYLFKSWKEILLGVLAIIGMLWLSHHADIRKQVVRDRLLQLITLYAFVSIGITLLHISTLSSDAMAAGILMNLRYLLIFSIAYIIARYLKIDYKQFRHIALRFLMWLGFALAIIGIVQVFLLDRNFLTQFGYDKATTIAPYVLIDDNPNALRAFATLRGPNDYAAFLILPALISLVLGVMQKRRYLVLSTTMLIAIVLSGSRSAWLGLFAASICVAFVLYGKDVLRSKKVIWSSLAGMFVGIAIVGLSLTIPAVRLAIFHSSPGDTSLTEGSTDNHWRATASGIERVIDAPFGSGLGSAGPASYYGERAKISENYYVQIAEETGVIGLGLFVAIIGMIMKRLYEMRPDTLAIVLLGAGIGLGLIGFWLHVWSDDPLSMTYFMITGIVLGSQTRAVASKSM